MGRFATANAQGGSTLKIDGPIPQEGLVSIPDAGTVALEWWHTVPTFSMKQCQIVVLYWQIGLNRKILTQEERIFWWVEEEKHVYLLRSCKLWLCLNRGHNILNPLVSQEFPYWNCHFGIILYKPSFSDAPTYELLWIEMHRSNPLSRIRVWPLWPQRKTPKMKWAGGWEGPRIYTHWDPKDANMLVQLLPFVTST